MVQLARMKKLLALVLIFLVLLFAAQGFWNFQLSAVNSQDKIAKNVIVAKGKSLNEIAKQLKDENLVRSALVFNLYTRQQGLASKLSAGTFKLSPAMSAPEIVKILSGPPNEVWVTLLEGWRVEEMAEELNSKLKIQSSKFLTSVKEGYLFPDTYLFPNDITEERITKILQDNFNQKYTDDLRSKIKALGLTEDEGVILASIVEREARSDEARRMAASILLKRLRMGMGLNADATVQYTLGYQPKEKSWWKRRLSKEDLKSNSPYNTYLYKNLPPTPICNPGLSSLKAVANADPQTPYLYYYHDSKGKAHYAKTLEEHNQNVANNP